MQAAQTGVQPLWEEGGEGGDDDLLGLELVEIIEFYVQDMKCVDNLEWVQQRASNAEGAAAPVCWGDAEGAGLGKGGFGRGDLAAAFLVPMGSLARIV